MNYLWKFSVKWLVEIDVSGLLKTWWNSTFGQSEAFSNDPETSNHQREILAKSVPCHLYAFENESKSGVMWEKETLKVLFTWDFKMFT